jgi:hypothetical protein
MDGPQNTEDPTIDMLPALGATAELLRNIPAPIRKNAFSAFNRLCTAAIDIPVAALEGNANEKRAQSLARVKLIETTTEQIARQMQTDPEYAHVAVRKFGEKILKERVNLDQIAGLAAEELTSGDANTTTSETPEASPISEDWINIFEDEAAQMSSEQMQQMFSRILAGEIRRPSSYSIRTIRILAQLDNTAASLFNRLCSLSISLAVPDTNTLLDARVVSMGSAATNSLQAYGLGFDQLNILQEYGLIISDYGSWRDYRLSVVNETNGARVVGLPLNYMNTPWVFVPKAGASHMGEFRVTGVALTRSGKELLSIVNKTENAQYTGALTNLFDQQGMIMTRFGA